MRYNKSIQDLADQKAISDGNVCAIYMGQAADSTFRFVGYEDEVHFIFRVLRHPDNILRDEGFPEAIVVCGNKVESVYGVESFDVLDSVKRPYRHKRGEFLLSKCKDSNDVYLSQIYMACHGALDYRLDRRTAIEFLEIAERLDMKLQFHLGPFDDDRLGGGDCYLELVK